MKRIHESSIPRNKPCPCGSLKKFKNCCWQKQIEQNNVANKMRDDLLYEQSMPGPLIVDEKVGEPKVDEPTRTIASLPRRQGRSQFALAVLASAAMMDHHKQP